MAIMLSVLLRQRVAWREYCRNNDELTLRKYLAEWADRFVPPGEWWNGGGSRVLTEVVESGDLVVDPLQMVFEERSVAVR